MSEVLDYAGKHYTLVQQIDTIAEVAGIPPAMIANGMSAFNCPQSDIDYVTQLYGHNDAGAVFVGANDVPLRLMAIAGACIRNFLDARVLMLRRFLDGIKDGEFNDVDVVLIPNFFVKKDDKTVSDWEIGNLLGVMYERKSKQQPMFLGVSNMDHLESRMGSVMASFIKENYTRL